jgi:molecular chaperone GrpE
MSNRKDKEVCVSSNDDQPSSTSELKKKLQAKNTDDLPIEFLEHPSYKEMQEKLTQAEEKADQHFEKLLRLQAEMENSQRRSERDVANAHKFALEKFIAELLPIIDNLERTIATAEENHVPSGLLEGVNLTLKLFYAALEKFGVQQINPENQPFNPEFHQAISTQVDTNVEPGTVLVVMQKGYLLNNRLIRPALVVVSKG